MTSKSPQATQISSQWLPACQSLVFHDVQRNSEVPLPLSPAVGDDARLYSIQRALYTGQNSTSACHNIEVRNGVRHNSLLQEHLQLQENSTVDSTQVDPLPRFSTQWLASAILVSGATKERFQGSLRGCLNAQF